MSLDVGIRTANIIRRLVERGFEQSAATVVSAITNSSNSGIIDQRLKELAEEAKRLAAEGKRLTTRNPVMRALLADMDDVIEENRRLMRAGGVQLQQSSFSSAQLSNQQLAFAGMTEAQAGLISAQWTSVDPEVMRELIGFVDNPQWETQLSEYGDAVVKRVKNQIIQGQVKGWGPVRMATEITNSIQGVPGGGGFPQSEAEKLMRTLQMQSFRTAQTINRVANADILAGQIRISALDGACLACVALHGEIFPIDERIDDHHSGRCTSIPLVKGFPRDVETGQEWWDSRTDAEQLAQARPANFNALKAGAVTLDDFPVPYEDPVFGDMLRESSLSGILGPGAQEFYTHG